MEWWVKPLREKTEAIPLLWFKIIATFTTSNGMAADTAITVEDTLG